MGTSTRFAACLAVMSAAMAGMLFLPACCSGSYMTPDERLAEEFDWSRPTWRTKEYNIPVAFPVWLAPEDRGKVLGRIDYYASRMEKYYPWTKENFDFSTYTVWIHDNLGAFVAGNQSDPTWALGWQVGEYCVVAWILRNDADGKPCGPAMHDIFPALVHEWFHAAFKERYGWADPGHFMYFPMPEVKMALLLSERDADALEPLLLSDESLYQALTYKYHPWIFPSKVL